MILFVNFINYRSSLSFSLHLERVDILLLCILLFSATSIVRTIIAFVRICIQDVRKYYFREKKGDWNKRSGFDY